MFTTCCRRHAASSGQRGASCTRYDARRARRRRRDQARREFTVLAGNWASSDTAARAATASRRVVHCTAQLALLRRAKRVPPPPPPPLKRSGVSVKTGPRLRDDMSIHTKRPSYFLSKGYRSARYFRHRFWQPPRAGSPQAEIPSMDKYKSSKGKHRCCGLCRAMARPGGGGERVARASRVTSNNIYSDDTALEMLNRRVQVEPTSS